jgi:hypothetical protein
MVQKVGEIQIKGERKHRTQKRGDIQKTTKTPEGGRKQHTRTISQFVVTNLAST